MKKTNRKVAIAPVVVVIPARYGSTRLPGKPLVMLAGKPMIQWVWEAAIRSRRVRAEHIVVATDDIRIQRVVKNFGGRAVITSRKHPTGTDRLAEVARKIPAKAYINVQGDEPLLEAAELDALAAAISKPGALPMATLAHRLTSEADWNNPSVVKVAVDRTGRALYFSRSPIPFLRQEKFSKVAGKGVRFWRHIGLYAYTREALLQFVRWPMGMLEQAECLEQLRALENGMSIQVLPSRFLGVSVDTKADVARAVSALRKRHTKVFSRKKS